jgi:hypothetical protein
MFEILGSSKGSEGCQAEIDETRWLVNPFRNNGSVRVDPCQKLQIRAVLEDDEFVLG